MQAFSHQHIQYAGFLRRATAFGLDMLIISVLTSGIIMLFFGVESIQHMQTFAIHDWRMVVIENVVPALWTIGFWFIFMATPAKMLFDCQVVDAESGQRASLLQLVVRYLGYIISSLPLGLGFLWILIDKRNQGWHDKLSKTLVIMQDESRLTLGHYT